MHEIFSENLRNPARGRREGAMRQFPTSQVYSTAVYTDEAVGRLAPLTYTVSLKLLYFSVVFTAPANCVEQRAHSCV